MKKVLSIFLTLIIMLAVFPIPASAEAVVLGGYADMLYGGLYYVIDDESNTAEVVGYELRDEETPAGEIAIPNAVTKNGVSYNVTSIGIGAFYQSLYTKITVPSSVTAIWDSAFAASIYLENVNVNGNCVFDYIGSSLFMGTQYEAQIYENDVTYLGKNVLYKYNGNGEFTIPDNITLVAPQAFMWSDVEKVVFNNNIAEIPEYCFESCNNLTNVVFTDSIVYVGEGAFKNCTSLENITLGKNVATLSLDCFANTKIKSIYLSTSIYEIAGAFRNCNTLETVTVDPGHSMLFVNNNRIYKKSTFLGINENGDLDNIEGVAIVYSNPKHTLGKVTLPNDVMLIDDYAFYGCKDLEELYCNKLMSVGIEAFRNSGIKVFNAKGMLENDYLISYGAFANCSNLTTINLENAAAIGNSAFENCTSLVDVKLNDYLSYIGAKAFANTGIREITIKNCTIEEGAFMNCKNLEKVTIGEGVTEIYKNAFLGCPNLKEISISKDVTYIDENAFNGCDNVTFKLIKGSKAYKYIKNNTKFNFEVVGRYTLWQRIIDFFRSIFG